MSDLTSSVTLFWDQIQKRIPNVEHSEIKQILGAETIDENTVYISFFDYL